MCSRCGCEDEDSEEDQVEEDNLQRFEEFEEQEQEPEVPPEIEEWANDRGMQADPEDLDTDGIVEEDYSEESQA
ncbi:MAG: hypothetical protein AAB443_04085 [Patescibacteria group bacterium]